MWIARIILVIIYIKWVCGSSTNRTLINRSLMTPPEPKLSICCQSGSFMTPSLDWRCSSNSSKPIHDPEIPPIFTQDLKPSTKKLDDFEKIYGIPCVSELYELLWDDSSGPETYYLLDNGEILITETTDNSSVAHVKNYCFASWMGENGTYTKVFACFSQWIDPVYMIFNIILILPIPFLAATFIVYALLPELRNTHGLILMGYISALFWSKLGSSLVRFEIVNKDNCQILCTLTGFIVYFWIVSSFSWLNVMCFDIWSIFRRSPALQCCSNGKERRKFILYSLYAWGYPSLMTGICIVMDFEPNISNEITKPKFGERGCWFQDSSSESVYFYYPVAVTVIWNVSLFVSTIMKVLQHNRKTGAQLNGSDSRRHDVQRQRGNLYMKLIVVMGINCSLDTITWAVGHQSQWGWYLEDILSTIQGIMLFVIFVYKDKVKRLLAQRFHSHQENTNGVV